MQRGSRWELRALGQEICRLLRRERQTVPSRETTCLNQVFRLKNVSNFTYDDIIFRSSKSIKMNVLHNHLRATKGHGLLFF